MGCRVSGGIRGGSGEGGVRAPAWGVRAPRDVGVSWDIGGC